MFGSFKINVSSLTKVNKKFFEIKICEPVCLLACQKDLNIEVNLISEFMNSEIRITSAKICLK